MDIKKIIKDVMKENKISGKKLSEKSGINYSTLMTFLKNDKASIRIDKVDSILSALDLEIAQIIK